MRVGVCWGAIFLGAAWLLPIGDVRASEITAFHPPVALTDVTIRDTFGARRKLSEMRGRPTLLIFWDTSCGRCLPDLASLVRVRRTAAYAGLSIIPIAVDRTGSASVAALYLAQGLTSLPTFVDAGGRAAQSLGISPVPGAILVDQAGRDVGHLQGSIDWTSPEGTLLLDGLISGSPLSRG